MDTDHLAVRFAQTALAHASRPATRIKDGDGWAVRTYRQLAQRVSLLAAHLIDAGIEAGDRVLLLANNRPEWSHIDLALLSIRAVPVPVYPTSTPEQIRHIAADSGAVFAVIENGRLLARFEQVWDEVPAVRGVWTFEPTSGDDDRVRLLADVVRSSGWGRTEVWRCRWMRGGWRRSRIRRSRSCSIRRCARRRARGTRMRSALMARR